MQESRNPLGCSRLSALLLIVVISPLLMMSQTLAFAVVGRRGTSSTSFSLSSLLSNTALLSSSSSSSSSSNDDVFMSSLRSRIDELGGQKVAVDDDDDEISSSPKSEKRKIPLVVLDSMLPRQSMKVQVNNPLFMQLIKSRVQQENPCFGVLGMAKLASGEKRMLKYGVEVTFDTPRIVADNFSTNDGEDDDQDSSLIGNTSSRRVLKGDDDRRKNDGAKRMSAVQLKLTAGLRFVVLGDVKSNPQGGWTEGKVQFLNSEQQEHDEVESGVDRMALARAMRKARELTSPNMLMPGNASLVDRWIELAKQKEHFPGQIDTLLSGLGPIPPIEEPSERAFWIGALINPLPALGVAIEIRPALLSAQTAEQRIMIAHGGIFRSIKHMDGSSPLI